MKTLAYYLSALVVMLVAIQGCKKSNLASANSNNLVARKSTLKINEPDSVVLINFNPADSVKWTIVPSGFDVLTFKKDTARIVFSKPGHYTITATGINMPPVTTSVTVTDSVYKPVITYTSIPLTGDQVTLVPHFYKSATSDSTYLVFVAQTKNIYCATSTLRETNSNDANGNYTLSFLDVSQPSICALGDGTIAAVVNFNQNQPAPLPVGTFPLNVTLNGTTYTGTIAATATTITFNWNYSAGVLISPKQISR